MRTHHLTRDQRLALAILIGIAILLPLAILSPRFLAWQVENKEQAVIDGPGTATSPNTL